MSSLILKSFDPWNYPNFKLFDFCLAIRFPISKPNFVSKDDSKDKV